MASEQLPCNRQEMDSWRDFWNAPNSIYVNRRHSLAHYTRLLDGILPFIPVGEHTTVLDYGCGDALAASAVVQKCGTLLLYDSSELTRRRLRATYGGQTHINVLDERELQTLAPASIDLILVNSVVQYLNLNEFTAALELFHGLLRNHGRLLLGDIVEPNTPLVAHVATFLSFALRNGFFFRAVGGLARNFASSYRKLRQTEGYACYSEDQMLALLGQNGFVGEHLRCNVAVSQVRSSYLASKR
jgi:ubiquinone/menaquinone biosynthesis C-methylase UbiE